MKAINYNFWMKVRILLHTILRLKPNKRRFNNDINSRFESNKIISNAIKSGKPFMAAKLGESELEVLRNYYAIERSQKKDCLLYRIIDFIKYGERVEWTGLNTIVKDSGFFPKKEELLYKFSELYISQIKIIDFFATAATMKGWYNNKGEDFIINKLNKSATILTTEIFDPFLFLETSWTIQLKGKKVLVIHPFEHSILNNYKNRLLQFPIPLLPNFVLITLKAEQTIANSTSNFINWFEALKYMQNKIDKIEFDIALIGCGAYGLPLAGYIKSVKHRQAIHIGGALQLYFGIKGNRWNTHPIISSFYNEYWTKPTFSETPENVNRFGSGDRDYW